MHNGNKNQIYTISTTTKANKNIRRVEMFNQKFWVQLIFIFHLNINLITIADDVEFQPIQIQRAKI